MHPSALKNYSSAPSFLHKHCIGSANQVFVVCLCEKKLKVRGHFQRETKITERRVAAGTAGTHLQVERLVLMDKEILTAGSMLLPLTPSANQPLAANFFPTLILAFNQMDTIPETQASTDKLSPRGQLV